MFTSVLNTSALKIGAVVVCVFLVASGVWAANTPGDIDSSGKVDAVDVQHVINGALNAQTGYDCDINGDGQINAVDIQLVINGALGIDIGLFVPDLVEMGQSEAEATIDEAGFTLGTFTETYDDTVPSGIVIGQDPVANSLRPQGTPVDLVISMGSGAGSSIQTIMLPGNVPMKMVWCPTGTFMMGRNAGEQNSYSYEDPQRLVTMSNGFWMGKYELTKRQWQAVMGTAPWSGLSYVLNDLDSPAVFASWNDAQAFITALNGLTGKVFCLPSEAQWEYACRAGTTTSFYWGDDPDYSLITDYAWYWGNCASEEYAHLVGQKLPNAWGLHDMSGNVWEWCEDDWHDGYADAPADGRAWLNTPRGPNRVARGGSWGNFGPESRSASRGYGHPLDVGRSIGFRVVRTP